MFILYISVDVCWLYLETLCAKKTVDYFFFGRTLLVRRISGTLKFRLISDNSVFGPPFFQK